MRALRFHLPPGDSGVWRTLRVMAYAAHEAASNPDVQDAAHRAIGSHRGEAAVAALREYLSRVRYVDDPHPDELVRSPAYMVDAIEAGGGEGDCDDTATLAAALALSLGWSARFRVIAQTPTGAFDHVWTEAAPPGSQWWELDTSRPAALPMGWKCYRTETIPL